MAKKPEPTTVKQVVKEREKIVKQGGEVKK